MDITPDQIEAAYAIASAVYDGRLSKPDGVSELRQAHGLNGTSAVHFIDDLRLMLQGQEFRRTLSTDATDYFLGRIANERGHEALATAVAANYAHLDYYASLPKGGPQRAKRVVVDKWAATLAAPPELAAVQAQFERDVERSQATAPELRRARLREAGKQPQRTRVMTDVFLRNPDVVAEVLDRARGICERCNKSAPFTRRSDRTPYLEVHHRKRLADGGEDTAENAIALCPNCHRDLHFGI